MVGHSLGHSAIAVRRDHGGWLLHCGDAYFHHHEMDYENPRCSKALDLFQRIVASDGAARVANQARLRELAHSDQEVSVFSAHDPEEFERWSAGGGES